MEPSPLVAREGGVEPRTGEEIGMGERPWTGETMNVERAPGWGEGTCRGSTTAAVGGWQSMASKPELVGTGEVDGGKRARGGGAGCGAG